MKERRKLPSKKKLTIREKLNAGLIVNPIRCSFSRKGLNTFGKNRRGYIIGKSQEGFLWNILWDGLTTPQRFHKDFIYVEKLTPNKLN